VRANGASDSADFRFLWRATVVVTRFNSEDEPVYEQLESINVLNLAVVAINRLQFLRIENPLRNLRDLMNAIESIVGLGFSCSPVTFETMRPSAFLERVETSRLVGLRIVNAVLGDDIVSRMEFASKNGIEIQRLRVLKGIPYKVDIAVFECAFRGSRGRVAIAAGGLVRFSGELAPRLTYLIERELPTLLKGQAGME
jgi:hypothetical protein